MKKKLELKLNENIKIKSIHAKYKVFSLHHTTAKELGEAFYDAYLNTIDYEGETVIDAIVEVKNSLLGAYGVINEEASGYILINDKVASAIIVTTKNDNAFIPYIFTRKEFSKKRLATFLMIRAIYQLKSINIPRVELYVTDGNLHAQKLYEKLGFKEVE